MDVIIRKFNENDVPFKVKWINDEENNQFLHYDLPLREDKTLLWFESIKNRTDRADYTILVNNEPVGLIGLIGIDSKNQKAEFYITIGVSTFKGKGVAKQAFDLLVRKCHKEYYLNKIYLYTEVENVSAQRLFDKIGFVKEGLLKQDLIQKNKKIDRYYYGLIMEDYLSKEKK